MDHTHIVWFASPILLDLFLFCLREQESSLYEGLKRMTQGRLDDQRGLEINGELPDFLKTAAQNQVEERQEGR